MPATQYQGERSAKNYEFVDAVARKNVELMMADIRRRSPVLTELETSGGIKIVGAMYDRENGPAPDPTRVRAHCAGLPTHDAIITRTPKSTIPKTPSIEPPLD